MFVSMMVSLLPMMSTMMADMGALIARAARVVIRRYAVSSKVVGMGDVSDKSWVK